jgi:hydroxypyruvate reductase
MGFQQEALESLMDKGSTGGGRGNGPGELLRAIALEAIRACDAGRAVARAAGSGASGLELVGRPVRPGPPGRLLLLAVGKAAAPMHEALLERLRDAGARRPVRSLVVAPAPAPAAPAKGAPRPSTKTVAVAATAPSAKTDGGGLRDLRVSRIAAEHPAPGPGSFRAGRAAQALLASARPGDDVIALVSGGGSAMLAAPLRPFLTMAEKTRLHQVLVASGAPISAINTVRKHLSAVKGGRLALAARRARSITTLAISDVDPHRFDEVASGPTVPDRTTLEDLVAVIDRYGLAPALPVKVLEALRTGRLPETPKPRDAAFRRARALMLLSNADLRAAAVRIGLTRGMAAEGMPNEITGPVEEAVELAARAIEAAPTGVRLLVLGGETRTVPVVAGAAGGRAQEFALRLALRMHRLSMRGWAFLAAGSDGVDGRSPAAGAFVDSTTIDRALALGLDPEKALRRSETWPLFRRLGDALVTGPTATNVRDLYLLMTGLPRPAGR